MARTSRVSRATGKISAAAALAPYQQGEFDGFCGIYAALNGLCLALAEQRPLNHQQCARLYKRGIGMLEEGGKLPFAATWGISQSRWRDIVAALCRSAGRAARRPIRMAQLFVTTQRYSRRQVFAAIDAAIHAQRPVLVALRGAYNHYTVICAYTPTRYVLYDSYDYRWIAKAACGVSHSPGVWRHRIATGSILELELGQ